MTIPCRLHEAEEIISEMDLCHVPDDIMESEEDYRIVISGFRMYIPELGICIHEGVFCNYDEEEKEYLPDFSITVIMDADTEMKEGEWLYYEQDVFFDNLSQLLQWKIYTVGVIRAVLCYLYYG